MKAQTCQHPSLKNCELIPRRDRKSTVLNSLRPRGWLVLCDDDTERFEDYVLRKQGLHTAAQSWHVARWYALQKKSLCNVAKNLRCILLHTDHDTFNKEHTYPRRQNLALLPRRLDWKRAIEDVERQQVHTSNLLLSAVVRYISSLIIHLKIMQTRKQGAKCLVCAEDLLLQKAAPIRDAMTGQHPPRTKHTIPDRQAVISQHPTQNEINGTLWK